MEDRKNQKKTNENVYNKIQNKIKKQSGRPKKSTCEEIQELEER